MAKRSRRVTKRKSNRLRSKTQSPQRKTNDNTTNEATRKSNRLLASIEAKKFPSLSTIPEHQCVQDGLTGRPSRQQCDILPTKIRCADISKESSMRLGIKSCFCCDNFRSDKPFLPKNVRQEDVSAKKYGCRRKEKIQVSVKYSHRTYKSIEESKLLSPTNKETIIDINSIPPTKPSATVKRKLAQWCRADKNNNETPIPKKKESDNLQKVKDAIKVEREVAIKNCKVKCDKKINELKAAHEATVKKMKRQHYYLTKQNKELTEKMSSGNLSVFVNELLKRMHFEKRATLVLDLVFSGEMFGEAGKKVGRQFITREVRKLLPAWRLCKAKDTAHQGCLNLQGIEAVRQIEPNLEKGEKGLIASKSSVWREGDELLKEVAYPFFKPTHTDHELGEVFTLDFERVIRFVLSIHGLTEIAQLYSVELAFSLDAAALTQGTSHIFAAVKNIDSRSKQNGRLLYVYEEDGLLKYRSLQSNKNVYMMMMVYAADGKQPYRLFFKDWFMFINKIKKEGLPYRDEHNPALKPFLVRIPQDTSSIQKSLNMGGACKACDLFCHMCACKSYGAGGQLFNWREKHLRCKRFCLSQPNPPSRCFHWEVDDDNEIIRKKQMISVLLMHDELRLFRLMPEVFTNNQLSAKAIKIHYQVNESLPSTHIEEDPSVKAGTRIQSDVTIADRFNNVTHIDYICPIETSHTRTAYSSLLDSELILRKMHRYCAFSVEIKQKYLRLSLRNGQHIIDMRRAVDRWCQVGENEKMMCVNDAVLCILHLELRCSENKIGNLLNEGFTHRKRPELVNDYTRKVEDIVNEGKVGQSTHQNQWKFPINKGKDGVATEFSLKGEAGKDILAKSDRIIRVALAHHAATFRDEWNAVLLKYQEVLQFLNRRTLFSESDIITFQKLADEYSEMWARLTGRDGQTNYEHFVRSGHLSHYFFLYGNLYKYSQQGFEAMMSKIKCIYSRCTSRGGNGSEVRSHILQICHFLMRLMLWNSGHGDAYLKKKYSGTDDAEYDENDLFLPTEL